MADFRKWLLAFAVVALLLSAVPANAQIVQSFICNANGGVPPIVRAEGVTELMGDLTLVCTGGSPTQVGVPIPLSNVQIFLNTNITSRIINSSNNLSEAILTIDEPFPSAANGGPVPTTQTPNPPVGSTALTQLGCQAGPIVGNGCDILGTGGGVGANGPYNGSTSSTVGLNRYNVFQGFQSAANAITWNGVPIDAPGTLATRVIRITNIRGNACQLGVSSTLVPTQIVEFVSVTGSQQVSINNPNQTVAFILPGLTIANGTGNFLQCNNLNGNLLGSFTGQTGNLSIRAREGFGSAFKPRHYGQYSGTPAAPVPDSPVSLQNVLGFPYNSESGFVSNIPGILGTGTGNGAVGVADTGTELTFQFAGIGAGVSLFVPTVIPLVAENTTTVTGVAVLVGGGGSGSATIGGVAFTGLGVSGTTAGVTYEVLLSNPNTIEDAIVPVYPAFISNTTNNLPGLGQATVQVNFAPLATVQTASASAPIPRFCQPYPTRNLFAVNICSCNLLFPFVTNQAGFDTGIAIANTSLDPFGTPTQQGNVKLNYYGNTAGGGAAPAAQTTTAVVAPGTELVFTLSNGGDHGIAATPGFQGYIIAQANFQWCHAFAFISDAGAQKLAEGYLAIQLDFYGGSGLNRTGVVGEVQGH
ncbi:MAG TPA: hypothetical protein VKU01_17210 [Bryobacteraceae bacterium]|nr:hypothetical protein [Bryobacteraceae bacterium]